MFAKLRSRNLYTFAAYMFVVGLFVYVFGQATCTNVDFVGWAICATSLVGAAIYAHLNGDIKRYGYPLYDSCFRRRYRYFGARSVSERAFTLPELLIVIVIIAIMVALLLPALAGAVRRTREAQISADINALSNALEVFRAEYGDYPPSRLVCCEDGNYAPSRFPVELRPAAQRSVQYLRRLFPRMNIRTDGAKTWVLNGKPTTPIAPKSVWHDFDGDDNPDGSYYVLQGHQCLALFLGGAPDVTNKAKGLISLSGLGRNPQFPFCASSDDPLAWHKWATTTRKPLCYNFPSQRLVLDGRFPGYIDTLGTKDDARYYVYFSAYGNNGYDPDDVNFVEDDDNGNPLVGAFEINSVGISSASPNPYTESPPLAITNNQFDTKSSFSAKFHKSNTFQIISAGYDRKYGIGGAFTNEATALPFWQAANNFVTGQTLDKNVRRFEGDNLTNFATSRLD